MIVSIDAENPLDKIKHKFKIKTFRKLRIEGNFLNLMKSIYEHPTDNIKSNDDSLKIENKTRTSSLTFPVTWSEIFGLCPQFLTQSS